MSVMRYHLVCVILTTVGILPGLGSLPLTLDESEVQTIRRISAICRNVVDYLAVSEVVEVTSESVTFLKNLTPGITTMRREVEARAKVIEGQGHREWLQRSLEQVKKLTPMLISGLRVYITTRSNDQNSEAAQSNRNFLVFEIRNEILEIKRIVQLTTYDESEWRVDDITVMKRALNLLEDNMAVAKDWLSNPAALPGRLGELAVRQILEDALKISSRCVSSEDHEAINMAVSDIKSMMDTVCELRRQGMGTSPEALVLDRHIDGKLCKLEEQCQHAVVNTEQSGVRKPAYTVAGKLDQARIWLSNLNANDKGLGEQATRHIINEGRSFADKIQGPKKQEMMRLCDEADTLTNELAELCKNGMGNNTQTLAIADQLRDTLQLLTNAMQDSVARKVAENFVEVEIPLKQLAAAALEPLDTPNRVGNFEQKAGNFDAHARQLVVTAQLVAMAGGSNSKTIVESIDSIAQEVQGLTPQVVKVARILLDKPNNAVYMKHFDALKQYWVENMDKLQGFVNEASDTALVIKAYEEGILFHTDRVEQSIENADTMGILSEVRRIGLLGDGLSKFAQHNADHSEDSKFADRLNESIRQLRDSITPMVQKAKQVVFNLGDPTAAQNWRSANQNLIDAMGGVKEALMPDNY